MSVSHFNHDLLCWSIYLCNNQLVKTSQLKFIVCFYVSPGRLHRPTSVPEPKAPSSAAWDSSCQCCWPWPLWLPWILPGSCWCPCSARRRLKDCMSTWWVSLWWVNQKLSLHLKRATPLTFSCRRSKAWPDNWYIGTIFSGWDCNISWITPHIKKVLLRIWVLTCLSASLLINVLGCRLWIYYSVAILDAVWHTLFCIGWDPLFMEVATHYMTSLVLRQAWHWFIKIWRDVYKFNSVVGFLSAVISEE